MVICQFFNECILKLGRIDPCSKCRCGKPGPGSKKATLIKAWVWILLVARILLHSAGIGVHAHYAWETHKELQAEEAKRLAYQDSEAEEELLAGRRNHRTLDTSDSFYSPYQYLINFWLWCAFAIPGRMLAFTSVIHMIFLFEYVVFQFAGLVKGKPALLQIWMISALVNPFPIIIFWIHYGPAIEPMWQAIEMGFWSASILFQVYEVWMLLVYCAILKGDEELEFGTLEEEIGFTYTRRQIEEQAMRQRMKDQYDERIAGGHLHVYEYAQWYLLEKHTDTRLK